MHLKRSEKLLQLQQQLLITATSLTNASAATAFEVTRAYFHPSFYSVVVPSRINASETWNRNSGITEMIDVFHRRCLQSILSISWRDHVINDKVMAWSGQLALHDIVATRRRRFVGHILRLPATRPASMALEWIPEGGRRRAGRPMRTWQDMLKEDLETMGVDRSDARDTARDRARWRQLVARCSTWNRRN